MTPPNDAAATREDVARELEIVERLHGVPIEKVTDLTQLEPELGYYEAGLRSLSDALGEDPSLEAPQHLRDV